MLTKIIVFSYEIFRNIFGGGGKKTFKRFRLGGGGIIKREII